MVYNLRSSQEIGYSSLKPNPDIMFHLEALRDEAQGKDFSSLFSLLSPLSSQKLLTPPTGSGGKVSSNTEELRNITSKMLEEFGHRCGRDSRESEKGLEWEREEERNASSLNAVFQWVLAHPNVLRFDEEAHQMWELFGGHWEFEEKRQRIGCVDVKDVWIEGMVLLGWFCLALISCWNIKTWCYVDLMQILEHAMKLEERETVIMVDSKKFKQVNIPTSQYTYWDATTPSISSHFFDLSFPRTLKN